MDFLENPRPQFTHWAVKSGLLDSPFVLFDVGVQGGMHPRWKNLGDALELYGFDPLEEPIISLVSQNRKNHHYFTIALGNEDCNRDLFVPEISFASSFAPRINNSGLNTGAGNYASVKTRSVPVRRFDTLLATGVINCRADFIKMDCEGFEPEILKGATQFIRGCGLIAMESETSFSVDAGMPYSHFFAVYEHIAGLGLDLTELASDRFVTSSFLRRAKQLRKGGALKATLARAAAFNALFTRNFKRVIPTSRDQVVKCAIVLELYGLLDSAYDLLQNFGDQRALEGADLLVADNRSWRRRVPLQRRKF